MSHKSKRMLAPDDQDALSISANNASKVPEPVEIVSELLIKRRRKNPQNPADGCSITTRSMRRRAASVAVFATTELLENILINVPMKDLLLNQRVCKKWKAVMDGSKALQQKLFFVPVGFKPNYYEVDLENWTDSPEDPDPFSIKFHDERQDSKGRVIERISEARFLTGLQHHPTSYSGFGVFKLNPLLQLRVSKTSRAQLVEDGITCLPHVPLLAQPSVEASWHRMFLTQPPVKRCLLGWPRPDHVSLASSLREVHDNDGIRAGALVQDARASLVQHAGASLKPDVTIGPALTIANTVVLKEGEAEETTLPALVLCLARIAGLTMML